MSDATASAAPSTRPIVLTLAFCSVVVAVMQTLIAPLLPSLPHLVHTNLSTATWLVTATLITGCIANPVFGRIGDMYGKRRMILISLGLMTLGSVVCGVSSNIGWLIAGRALQGAALAVVSLSLSVIRDELPPDRVPGAAALISATLGTGGAIGFPVAAVFIEYFDWHAMFWVAAALGVIDIVLVLRFVPESPNRSAGRFDVAGAVILTLGLIALLLGIEQGSTWGWTSTRTLVSFALAVVLLLAFGRWELGLPSPLVDLRITRQAAVLRTNLASLLIGFAFYGNVLTTSLLIQEPKATGYGLGESIVVAGLCILPGGLVQAACAPIIAAVARRRGPKPIMAAGCIVMIAGYVYRIPLSRDLTNIVIGSTLVSIGTALAYSTLALMVMRVVPVSQTAAANGQNSLMRSIGQSISSAVVASVLGAVTVTIAGGTTAATLWAYQLTFILAGLGALAGLALTLSIPDRRAEPVVPVPAREFLSTTPTPDSELSE